VRRPRAQGVGSGPPVRRELLQLVLAVLVVDALFIAGYFLFRLSLAAHPVKIAYTAGWTIATLLVVLRALTRIRTLRRQPR
jgi:hypothetical protein